MLLALKCVNDVKSFGSRFEMLELIKEWEPDYMVVGGDYKDKEVIGSEYAKELVFFDRLPAYSTTNILNYYNT